jgi:hypothetical protein
MGPHYWYCIFQTLSQSKKVVHSGSLNQALVFFFRTAATHSRLKRFSSFTG